MNGLITVVNVSLMSNKRSCLARTGYCVDELIKIRSYLNDTRCRQSDEMYFADSTLYLFGNRKSGPLFRGMVDFCSFMVET